MKFSVKETEETFRSIVDENGNEVATVWSAYSGDVEATSRLFAAAPELLEVLEAIIERWDTPLWKDVPHTAEYINAARLIVAKAKGE